MKLPDFLNVEQDPDPAFVSMMRGVLAVSAAAAWLIAAVVAWTSRLYLSIAVVFGAGVLFAVSLLLSYRGVFWLGKILLPLATLCAVVFASVKGNGMHDSAVYGFTVVIVFGALFIGQKAIFWATLLSLLGMGFVVYADMSGWNPSPIAYKTGWDDVLIAASFQIVTALSLRALMFRLNSALAAARQGENALRESNRELEAIRASLEEKVAERARVAELARAQAEAQAWLARGQAQLAECMRGDLELETLANNIASHLCQYVGAQCAALFVASDGVLTLTGRFALKNDERLRLSFRLGEGCVGEAAFAGKITRLSQIPPDAPLIVSALGEAVPREILLVPLESNGQVFGVLELLAFRSFSERQEDFLRLVSESAAIAIRSAQTRAQINQLLSMT